MFLINLWCTEREKGRITTSGINSLSLKNKKEKNKNKNKEKIYFWKTDVFETGNMRITKKMNIN